MTVIIFLIVLAVLIFVHELGHFIFARMNGIRVDSFKIGFGPRLIHWTKGETEYGLNLIPFGGFVKIFGENPDEENTFGPDKDRSFVHKNRWRQAAVLVAGVLFNFIFAWILYVIVFACGMTAAPGDFQQYVSRFHDPRTIITYVSDNSPAKKAGLNPGDTITKISVPSTHAELSLNGTSSTTKLSATVIPDTVNASLGTPVIVSFMHGGQASTTTITPSGTLVPGRFVVGIQLADAVTLRLPILTAIYEATHYTWITMEQTAVGLFIFITSIFQGTAQWSQVSGPVGIAADVGNVLSLGFMSLLMFTALISVNLGIINLIPFPALDGGRILFVAIEGIFRRRISAKFTNIVNTVGYILLMILMVEVTYKDIAKLVQH